MKPGWLASKPENPSFYTLSPGTEITSRLHHAQLFSAFARSSGVPTEVCMASALPILSPSPITGLFKSPCVLYSVKPPLHEGPGCPLTMAWVLRSGLPLTPPFSAPAVSSPSLPLSASFPSLLPHIFRLLP